MAFSAQRFSWKRLSCWLCGDGPNQKFQTIWPSEVERLWKIWNGKIHAIAAAYPMPDSMENEFKAKMRTLLELDSQFATPLKGKITLKITPGFWALFFDWKFCSVIQSVDQFCGSLPTTSNDTQYFDCHPVLISWSHAADVDRSISHHLRHVAVLWARRFSGCSFSPPEHQRSSSVPCRTSSQFPTEYPTEYSSSAHEERIIIVSVNLCVISLAWARDE